LFKEVTKSDNPSYILKLTKLNLVLSKLETVTTATFVILNQEIVQV